MFLTFRLILIRFFFRFCGRFQKNIRRSESPQERFKNLFSRGSILILRFLTFHMILYKFSYDFDFYFGFEALNSIGYGGDDRFYAFGIAGFVNSIFLSW